MSHSCTQLKLSYSLCPIIVLPYFMGNFRDIVSRTCQAPMYDRVLLLDQRQPGHGVVSMCR